MPGIWAGSIWGEAGSSGGYTPKIDVFSSISGETELVLNFAPVLNPEIVSFCGRILAPGIGKDYTVSGSSINLNFNPNSGRVLTVHYWT